MSRVFAVTAVSNTVQIDAQRQGEASFTVTNTCGEALQGRANIVVSGDVKESWFSIMGQSERNFDDEETHQFVVKIDIPENVEKGDYHFSIDLVSVENPDEDYVEGPIVSFVVTEAEIIKEKTWIEKNWWVIAIVSALVIIGGILTWVFSGSQVPNVVGKLKNDAETIIVESGYSVGGTKFESAGRMPGIVIRTEPAAGSDYEKNSPVVIFVEKEAVDDTGKRINGEQCQNHTNCMSGLCRDKKCARNRGIILDRELLIQPQLQKLDIVR